MRREWQRAPSQSEQQTLLKSLVRLADKLSIPLDQVLTEEPLTDAVYESLQRDIGYEEKGLSRRLTREAMARAGI